MENYNDWLSDQAQNQEEKQCAECGEQHQNNGNYCTLQCANESMR